MHEWVIFLFIVLASICLGFNVWFSIKGAIDIKKSTHYSGGNGDHKYHEAHKWLTWASIVATVAGAILIVGGAIIMVAFGSEILALGAIGKVIFTIFLLILLGLLITLGIFHALALQQLLKSSNYKNDKWAHKTFIDSLIGVGFGFGCVVVLIVGFIIQIAIAERRKKKSKLGGLPMGIPE